MEFQILYTEAALADLEEVAEYCWNEFPATAEQFGYGLLAHIEILSRFPFTGRVVRGRIAVRQLVHTPLVVDYAVRIRERRLEILSIRHGARDSHLSVSFRSGPFAATIGRRRPAIISLIAVG